MKNILVLLIGVGWDIIGFVVALFRLYLLPQRSIDHSGLHTFEGQVMDAAVQTKLRLHRWLSLLQHSPTA